TERQAQLCDGLGDEAVIELDAIHRIALASFPVARVEAHGRPARDDAELGVVEPECVDDVPSALGCDSCGHRPGMIGRRTANGTAATALRSRPETVAAAP